MVVKKEMKSYGLRAKVVRLDPRFLSCVCRLKADYRKSSAYNGRPAIHPYKNVRNILERLGVERKPSNSNEKTQKKTKES